jgi:catechol-2,3-dioxygenase
MPIHRLNHAVLYVRDAARSADFYSDVLGFRRLPVPIPGAVFLQAEGSTNDHDLGLFSIGDGAADSPAGRQTVGLYHLAWEVDTLTDLAEIGTKLSETGSLVGATDHGTTKAVYGKDPDGIEFEIAWIVPADRITEDMTMTARPLDLAKEIDHFGGDTLGGIGISRVGPVDVSAQESTR